MDPLRKKASSAGFDLTDPFLRYPLFTRLAGLAHEAFDEEDLVGFCGVMRSLLSLTESTHNPVLRECARALLGRPAWIAPVLAQVDAQLEHPALVENLAFELNALCEEAVEAQEWDLFVFRLTLLNGLACKRPSQVMHDGIGRMLGAVLPKLPPDAHLASALEVGRGLLGLGCPPPKHWREALERRLALAPADEASVLQDELENA
ncbi:MAG: hypothetical protein KC910_04440 [Candidatus Eremiobacteraeota bacterium]|nr:hypothetical protein [Candidatus Eremiobacteraeota bacterium]